MTTSLTRSRPRSSIRSTLFLLGCGVRHGRERPVARADVEAADATAKGAACGAPTPSLPKCGRNWTKHAGRWRIAILPTTPSRPGRNRRGHNPRRRGRPAGQRPEPVVPRLVEAEGDHRSEGRSRRDPGACSKRPRPAARSPRRRRRRFVATTSRMFVRRPRGPFSRCSRRMRPCRRRGPSWMAEIVATYIFKDSDKPRDAFVMLRGRYDHPGPKVEPGTPAVLPPAFTGWLECPGHASRPCELAGGSRAPLDGTRHRESVLAADVRHGARQSRLRLRHARRAAEPSRSCSTGYPSPSAKAAGTSRRLRPSDGELGDVPPVVADDARVAEAGPRESALRPRPALRLDAEQIRDNALFVSGLINLGMGGRGVKPYQPPNIWEPVAYTGSNTRSYKPDEGRPSTAAASTRS